VTAAALCLGSLINLPDLSEVQRRRGSNARAAFSAAVQNPMLKDPLQPGLPLELAALIVAEERSGDPMLMPSHISSGIRSKIEQITAPAGKRIALSRALSGGGEVASEVTATAVATTLFGSHGAPDDGAKASFFTCRPHEPFDVREEDLKDYFDPQNLYLDSVLRRRKGVPLATSLIAAEACAQLGLTMVGLRSPTALLLAPADGTPIVLDCFRGGMVMGDEDAVAALSERLLPADLSSGLSPGGEGTAVPAGDGQAEERSMATGRAQLAAMRASPMTALQWGAEYLGSLREMYDERGDVVRLIGVCDRLRMIGAHSRLAVGNDEMRELSGQLALCIHRLRWDQRRNEARALLRGLLRSFDEMGFDPDEPARIEALLADPWFQEA